MTPHKKLIVLVGPTAVGKTAVAIRIALNYGTDVISADSRQIFREMTIGTAKPSPDDLALVKHHFIDSHSIFDDYDAAQFGRDALALIHKLFENHSHVVLCGGSGLYIRAVCEGFDDIPEIPSDVRQELIAEFEAFGLDKLQQKMKLLDPEHFGQIDVRNPHRLIRALEVVIGTGASITSFQKKMKPVHPFDIVKIGLELTRQELYARIDERMDKMIDLGLFAEAERLYKHKSINALQTVGYQEIFDYMDGKNDKAEAIRLLKRNSRRYAKRQLTWFKRDPEIIWKHPSDLDQIMAVIDSTN